MRRRDFIQLAVASVAGLGVNAIDGKAFGRGLPLAPVSVQAELGKFFPPLELMNRVRRAEGAGTSFFLSSQKGPGSNGNNFPRTLDVAIRYPGTGGNDTGGNLDDEARNWTTRQIAKFLEKEFQYRVVNTSAGAEPAFWYPYLEKAHGNVVFCRLVVTKASSDVAV